MFFLLLYINNNTKKYILYHKIFNFNFFLFRVKQKNLNRIKLIPIIKCIILCGRQEIALRGHRDSGSINFGG